MDHVRAPQSLSDTGNMVENWCTWKQQFELFMDLTENTFINQPKSIKAKLLLNFIGPVGVSALDKITFNDPTDKEDMQILLQKFDEYFNPPKNEMEERHKFFTEKKNNNMSLDDYIEKLKKRAETCNFGLLEESMIRHKVIIDIKDKALLKKIFNTEELSLENLVTIIEAHIAKQVLLKESKNSNESKDSGESKSSNESKDSRESKNSTESKESKTSVENSNTAEKQSTPHAKVCWRCKKNHALGQCPEYYHVCESCGSRGHINDPHACRIALLKKKQYERSNNMDNVKNPNTNMTNLKMNVLDTPKVENNCYQENLHTKRNFYPEKLHTQSNFNPEKSYTIKSEPILTNTQPSAPPLYNSLYPNIKPTESRDLPLSTTKEASNKYVPQKPYVPPRTNVQLVQTQCSAKKVNPPRERKHSNGCVLS